MTTDGVVYVLVIAGAVPATLFVILYPILSPSFWRSWIGRALEISALALALLLDLSVASRYFGHPLTPAVRLALVALIALGAWLEFLALLINVNRAIREFGKGE